MNPVAGRPGVTASRRAWFALAFVAGLLAAMPTLLLRIRGSSSAKTALDLHVRPRALANLSFSDGQAKPTSLAAFRGRVVLLNVWATWCLPCREEMPTLDRLQAMLGGPAFEVVALSVDQTGLPAVQVFYRQIGVKHLQPYLDSSGEAMSSLIATGIPLTLLIDQEGREIGRKLGPATWDDPTVVEVIRGQIAPSGARPHSARG